MQGFTLTNASSPSKRKMNLFHLLGLHLCFFIISSVVLAEEMEQLHLYKYEEYGNIND